MSSVFVLASENQNDSIALLGATRAKYRKRQPSNIKIKLEEALSFCFTFVLYCVHVCILMEFSVWVDNINTYKTFNVPTHAPITIFC